MKTVMIDIDDTITNQDNWIYLVNDFLKSNYTIDDVEGYNIQDLVPENKKKEFIKYFNDKNIYDYCKIYDDCIEVIKKLNSKYDVYICSSYLFPDNIIYSAKLLKDKFEFLYKVFPFINPKNFIFCNYKSFLNFDIKIDDSINHLENAEVKLLYTAYHNKSMSDKLLLENNVKRVNNWKEIENILL